MKDERLRVLKMVEENKISTEDAIKLLDALHHTKSEDMDKEIYNKVSSFSKSVENFAKDVGGRMNDAVKNMEPKVKKATRSMVEKTAVVVDDISESLNESLSSWDEETDEDKEVCEPVVHFDNIDGDNPEQESPEEIAEGKEEAEEVASDTQSDEEDDNTTNLEN